MRNFLDFYEKNMLQDDLNALAEKDKEVQSALFKEQPPKEEKKEEVKDPFAGIDEKLLQDDGFIDRLLERIEYIKSQKAEVASAETLGEEVSEDGVE